MVSTYDQIFNEDSLAASAGVMFSGDRGLGAMDDFGLLGASWGQSPFMLSWQHGHAGPSYLSFAGLMWS